MSKRTAAFLILGLTVSSLGPTPTTSGAGPLDDPARARGTAPAGTGSEPADPREGASEGIVVRIQDLAFSPNVIRLKRGQTITWVNGDDFAHSATAGDGSFDTGILRPGERAQVTFQKTGTFPYYCAPHPVMKASVIVEE